MTIEKMLFVPVYKADIEIDNEKIIDALETEFFRPPSQGTSQTLPNLQKVDALEELVKSISIHYNKYMVEIGKIEHKHKIVAMWANRFEDGIIPYHTHQNSFVSGVYYVKQSEPPRGTIFSSLWQEQLMLDNSRIIRDSELESKTGTLIMFPSFVPHYTYQTTDRVTISWNILPYEMGAKKLLTYTKFFE